MVDIKIILPPRDNDALSDGLRDLTKAICEAFPEDHDGGFGLGGAFGYGCDFENDVFVMRRFYWGDCTCGLEDRSERWWKANPHSQDCYTLERDRRLKKAGLHYTQRKYNDPKMSWDKLQKEEAKIVKPLCEERGLSYPAGSAVHCDCGASDKAQQAQELNHSGDCPVMLPNFKHKRTGLTVEWYKWIGRDNEVNGPTDDIPGIIAECIASLKKPIPEHFDPVTGEKA